jgi:D-beta-D-heptose 7-phosphate kinase/D-beta-D-heptose 1-phosphate adenosyltransferase
MKLPAFEKARVLVVGDVMLDRYLHGKVSRISPEAPVPLANITRVEERVGGAGNVALNISSLGGFASLLGLVGRDDAARILEGLLEQNGTEHRLLPVENSPTIIKSRVIGHNQQLIRLDFEEKFTQWDEVAFLADFQSRLANSDLVVFSDYAKGTLGQVKQLIAIARQKQKPVLVDPKGKDFSIYYGATLITPNLAEFEAVVGTCHNEKEIELKALDLMKQYEFQAVLITRGAKGMSLISSDRPALHLPTKAREVYDVTGAGDSVIATLAATLAVGEDLSQAVMLANTAAGIAVGKLGAAAVSRQELQQAVHPNPAIQAAILTEEQLVKQISAARAAGEKIIMTNGCFDILHPGHVIYLEKAKALGHRLIIAVNDDDSVRSLKGSSRPVNSLQARMTVLSALASVDWVVPFSEDTPGRIINLVSPDVLVKGGDYNPSQIAGADHVQGYGGKVIIVPFEEGFSTTSMIEKITSSLQFV